MSLAGPLVAWATQSAEDRLRLGRTLRSDILSNGNLGCFGDMPKDIAALLLRIDANQEGVDVGITLPPNDSAGPLEVRRSPDLRDLAIDWLGEQIWNHQKSATKLLSRVGWCEVWGGLLIRDTNGNPHDGAVLRIRVAVSHGAPSGPNGDRVWLVPWSRFVPTEDTWTIWGPRLSQTVQWAEAEGLLKDSETVAIDLVREYNFLDQLPGPKMPQQRSFEGESLGLPVALALFALSRGRKLHVWATGEIDGTVERVDGVKFKMTAFRDFLQEQDPRSRDFQSGSNRTCVMLVPEANLSEAETIFPPAAVPGESEHVAVNRVPGSGQRVQVRSLKDVRNCICVLADQFVVKDEARPKGTPDPDDQALFNDSLPDLAGLLVNQWTASAAATAGNTAAAMPSSPPSKPIGTVPADYDEILLCTPFHDKADKAAKVLRFAAEQLAAAIASRRATSARPCPAPLVWDLAEVAPDQLATREGIRKILYKHDWLYDRLIENELRVALGVPNEVVFIIIDTATTNNGFQLRQRTFGDDAAKLIRQVFQCIRSPQQENLSFRPQRIIWIFPDLHVQLFAEQCLRGLTTSERFKPVTFPDAKPIQN